MEDRVLEKAEVYSEAKKAEAEAEEKAEEDEPVEVEDAEEVEGGGGWESSSKVSSVRPRSLA